MGESEKGGMNESGQGGLNQRGQWKEADEQRRTRSQLRENSHGAFHSINQTCKHGGCETAISLID